MIRRDERDAIDACLMEAGWPPVDWGRRTVESKMSDGSTYKEDSPCAPSEVVDRGLLDDWWAAYRKAFRLVTPC